MLNVKKTNLAAKSISGILLIVMLLTTACPIITYAASDNPANSTIEAFPDLGVSLDTMNENLGTINNLYNGGTVKDNKGHISSSGGVVYENHGSIEHLSAGHVGTNSGTIYRIDNSGLLSVNDKGGTVLYVGMGNVVDRNDGIIQENAGKVSDNYGTVSDNYGTVIMHDGQVVNNYQNGTVMFETKISGGNTIPAKGAIDNNKGHVTIHSGTVRIKENERDIEISNATVTVEKNSGNITAGDNATLICNENTSGGVITKTSESAAITCTCNDGNIYDETAVMYKIVFVGDDGKAEIIYSDLEKDGAYYTQFGSGVIFTLPLEYECSAATKLKSGDVNTWGLNAQPEAEDTEFTIVCNKRSICDSQGHKFNEYISNGDATCIADGTKTANCANGCGAADTITDIGSAKGHTYIDWVTTKEATETETGTRERTCSVCGYKDKDVIPVLPHTHNGTLQSGASASCLAAGVKDYYICSCGKAFEDAACNIKIADIEAWKAEGGNGYIAPKGHSYGEWAIEKEPTLTENGSKVRTCTVCDTKETEKIPVLTPVAYSMISGADSEWTKGSTSGLTFSSSAPFDKFDSVKIDGVTVAAANYTAESGSTRITISPAYLETLGTGEHSIEIVSTDGAASANFKVIAAKAADPSKPIDPAFPQTGDNSHMFLWLVLLFVSSVVLAGTAAAGKNGKKRP